MTKSLQIHFLAFLAIPSSKYQKNPALTSRRGLQSKDAYISWTDIHKSQMVENLTDLYTNSCFLVDIQIYYYIEFFQKVYLT